MTNAVAVLERMTIERFAAERDAAAAKAVAGETLSKAEMLYLRGMLREEDFEALDDDQYRLTPEALAAYRATAERMVANG
jgi:hypothetical protein